MNYQGCQKAEDYKGFPVGHAEVGLEVKHDGYRLLAWIHAGVVTFYCGDLNPVQWGENLGFIAAELLELGFSDCMVDGEVMADDWNETGIVRRKNPTGEMKSRLEATVKFKVFDYVQPKLFKREGWGNRAYTMDPTPFSFRRELLAGHFAGKMSRSVKLSELFICETDDAVQAIFTRLVAEGHEGGMVKLLNAPYKLRRSEGWQKVKPFISTEMEIVGFQEGAGKYVGAMGALICKDVKGVQVAVGTGFDDDTRRRFWAEQAELLGKIVEVKSQGGTSCKATMRHPVFMRMRPDRTSL